MKKNYHFVLLNIFLTVLISISVSTFYINSEFKNFKALNFAKTQNVFVEESNLINSIEKASPAVVSIIAKKELQQFYNPFGFFNFFGHDLNQFRTQEEPSEKTKIGGGTGFIIDSSGLVLTNKHVVSDSSADYSVIFSNDNTEMYADVLSLDPFTDLAVIQLYTNEEKTKKPENLPMVELGDSSSLKVGSQVIAIGNALSEFSNTTTYGIVSGLSRNIQAQDANGRSSKLTNLLQTDASINPGNSGGPLINLAGQVVGINTAVAQSADGIGFAIPINEAKVVVESVLKYGKIVRPSLGIRYIELNKTLAENLNLPAESGALVTADLENGIPATLKGSPAEKVGIQAFDIIKSVNGTPIDSENSLIDLIQKQKIDDSVELIVIRNKKEIKVTVKLFEYEFNNN